MKIYLISDYEELNRISKLKLAGNHEIFLDMVSEYGFIVDKCGDEEIALAFKLYDKTNTNSLSVIDRLLKEITVHLFTNIESKHLWFIDMKETLKTLGISYSGNKRLVDVKIYGTLTNDKYMPGLTLRNNYCDFLTFVESRKKIYDLLNLPIDIQPLSIYDIIVDSIDAYLTIERKGFRFDMDKIDKGVLNTLEVREDKLYFTYNLTGTVTGRTSSKIHPLSKDIKKHISPDPGKVFVNFDYNAAEARVLAHYSEDENLLDIFKANQDLHKINAALIFQKKSEEEVSPQERIIAKLVFFSIINGVSSKSLADELKRWKIDNERIKEIRLALQKIYPKAFAWLSEIQNVALNKKSITNMFGRTRYFTDEDIKDKDKTRRQASNMMIQSTLSDIKLIALNRINQKYGYLVAEFHDALQAEIFFNNDLNKVIQDIMMLMTSFVGEYNFKCPLSVDYEVKKHL